MQAMNRTEQTVIVAADGRRPRWSGCSGMRGLRRLVLAICLAALIAPALAATSANALADIGGLAPLAKHIRTTHLINSLLRKYHYRKVSLDNALSGEILEAYLDALDPNRSYFLSRDIQEFKRHRYRFDDYLRAGELKPAYAVFAVFRKRVEERIAYARQLVNQDFDFSAHESYRIDRREDSWTTDRETLDEIWRKRVKNDVLSLRLEGVAREEIVDVLDKRYERIARRTAQLSSDDVFSLFINAYVSAIEPHTAYFSPRSSENFRIRMSLSLEGIGAVLQMDDDYTRIRRVVPGGPAENSGELGDGDRIVGVAQGEEAFVDVIGWRLDDVVELIRGPKGTVVRLSILPKDAGAHGPTRIVSLVRNKIKLEEQAAQSSVLDVAGENGPMRIGVIELPTFYVDFDARARGESDYRSTTRDVKRLLQELQQDGVAGIVIDLRGNGGGSLSEATSLTGLFIESGPIVQVRDTSGRIQINSDPDPSIVYSGPLAVLVDRESASASEIFAGAMQDYGRGLIIGEPTFGKGTVQNLVDLDDFSDGRYGSLGQLKVTIAQFFRVNGDSTQHRGVVPDIVFPTAVDAEMHGERALENALPWATVTAARYVPHAAGSARSVFDRARVEHEQRVRGSDRFQSLIVELAQRDENSEDTAVSLHEETRRAERDTRQAEGDEANPEAASEGDQEPDLLLEETSHILVDFILFSRDLVPSRQAQHAAASADDHLVIMTPEQGSRPDGDSAR